MIAFRPMQKNDVPRIAELERRVPFIVNCATASPITV